MSPGIAGDIFNLSGDAQYEGRWRGLEVLRAAAGVDVRVTTELEANLCHGVEVAVRARASAEARVALSVFLAAAGEVSAFAQAGANVKVTLAPNLFDRFGLVADVGAFAEASVAGRLSIGLDIGQIKSLAAGLITEDSTLMPNALALKIFEAFLDELQIGAGIWGRAAFSAMARAHLEVYGSLADPERAGFVFELGGAVGLEAGTGWDFFAFARLVDVHRFYARSADLITAEVVKQGRLRLDRSHEPALQMIDLCLPAVLQVAMVAGQTAATQMLADSDRIVEPTVRAVIEQMRRFIVRKFVDIGERLLTDLVTDVAEVVGARSIGDDERQRVREQIDTLITALQGDEAWNIDRLASVAAPLSELVMALLPDEVASWREPLTIAWCGLAITKALDEAGSGLTAGGSASIGGVGVGASLTEQDFALADAPDFVLDEFELHFGGRPTRLAFSDAVDYIGARYVGPHLDVVLPELAPLLDLLQRHLDLSPGDALSALLLGSAGGDLGSTELYGKLRAFLRETIDEHVDALLIQLRDGLGAGDDAQIYLAEVVEPSLLGCTHFVFERLDRVVAGDFGAAFDDSFKVGVSNLVYKVFARNVIVLGHILTDRVLDEVERSLGELRDDVADDADHVLVSSAATLVQALVRDAVPEPVVAAASHRLVEQLVAAGEQTFGSGIWTPGRRTQLRRLMLEALVGDDLAVDYRSGSGLQDVFTEIAHCNHVPNANALGELGGLLADVTLDQARVGLRVIVPALAEFYLALTSEWVLDMDRRARQAIDGVAAWIEQTLRQIANWVGEAARWLEQAEASALAMAERLALASTWMADPQRRGAILNRVRADGIAAVAAGVAAVTPLWSQLDAQARAFALSLPLATFELAFDLARPLLDNALLCLADMGAALADGVARATTADDVATAAGVAVVDAVRAAIDQQIASFGLALPAQITVEDVASVARSLLLTEQQLVWLRQAHAALQSQNGFNALAADARGHEAAERARLVDLRAQQAAAQGGPLAVRIMSPLSLGRDAGGELVYGPRVPWVIEVDGARQSFVQAGALRRIFLSVNGRRLAYAADDWQVTHGGLAYRAEHRFEAGLLAAGLNVLECSVSDGRDTLLRSEARFVVDPSAPVLNVVAVDAADSCFDVPDRNDHAAAAAEHVTLLNTGSVPVLLLGWEIRDAALHRLRLPDRTLAPGARLRIVTGSGTEADDRVHWNRRQAVWNNRGDTVRLIDGEGVLRIEYAYGAAKESR